MRLLKQKKQLKEEAPLGASVLSPSVMRVRMLRRAHTAWGFMEPGRVVNLPASVAAHWLEDGLCEQDKMLEGAPATK